VCLDRIIYIEDESHVTASENDKTGPVQGRFRTASSGQDGEIKSKAKMCNGRRHVPLCPASANEK